MDTSLPALIEFWLSSLPESTDSEARLEQIITATLRKRKIAKRRPEQPKAAIYANIADALAEKLRASLRQASQSASGMITETWLLHTLTQAYPEVLTYDRLTQLATVLQQQPPKSPGWAYAVTTLFDAVELSDKLRRPTWAAKSTPEDYADIRNEALANAVKNIHNFDPNRSHFIGWINQIYLGRRGIDTFTKEQDTLVRGKLIQKRKITRLKEVLSQILNNANLDGLKIHLSAYLLSAKLTSNLSGQDHALGWSAALSLLSEHVEETNQLVADLSQWLLNDIIETVNLDTPLSHNDGSKQSLESITVAPVAEPPYSRYLMECLDACDGDSCNALLEKHLRGHPAATLRFIAQERLQGKTLKETGNLFGASPQTIRNFYERNIKHVTKCLKQCVENKIEIWKLQNPT